MSCINSITVRSKNFGVTANKGEGSRTLVVIANHQEISYADALELEKEFSEVIQYALNVKL